MPVPRYMQFPDEYMQHVETKKHHKKCSKRFMTAYRANPSNFVESRSVVPSPVTAINPVVVPLPSRPEPELKQASIGEPIPKPEPPQPTAEEKEAERMRQQIQHLIRAELRSNPQPYEAKSADELSQLFRRMLIDKLAPAQNTPINNKPKPIPKSAKQQKEVSYNFKLKPPASESDVEEFEDISSEED